ncbi:hypothetical protein [Sphingomonas sp. R86521]|uniref:hypothetical protein n=1 Tax=Sphingomonas sp. R86521 TaxID=3093860 RepID=UPI0036D21EB0
MKRQAAVGALAADRLAGIEASISALNDEDLLDLADIFSGDARTHLGDSASAELRRRNLSP